MGVLFCKEDKNAPPPTYDIHRCGPMRYMGFASVLASKMVPRSFAHIPQMAATAYIFSDVFSKTSTSVQNDEDPHRVAVTATDAILWQTMASVIAPLLLFSGLKSVSKSIFLKAPRPSSFRNSNWTKGKKSDTCGNTQPPPPALPPTKPQWPKGKSTKPIPYYVNFIPAAVALMLMPYIIDPVHNTVDSIMDQTYRLWAKQYLNEYELSPEERKKREKERKIKEEIEAKEYAEKLKRYEQARKEREKDTARIAAEREKQKAKEEECLKARRAFEEKEAKAREKRRCIEEERMRTERRIEEERSMKERFKQEEAELLKKKAELDRLLKEQKEKSACD